MEINEIIEELKYCTGELPKEAIKEAVRQREEIIPKLIEMLEYTKVNLYEICNGQDEFFGYIYAFFLLAQFRDKRAFPYLIDLLNKDEEIVECILGDDYPEHLPRLLASTYNGDDEALFSIIENKEIEEFIRSSVLQTFGILYLNGEKDREFITNYFTKLINEREEDDESFLYDEIVIEAEYLRLIELEGIIEKIFYFVDNSVIERLKNTFENEDYEINRDIYPFNPFYNYIEDVIDIMEEWKCFREIEDEEFEKSDDYKIGEYIINTRRNNVDDSIIDLGRNDLCYCGSGKKYKKCCMSKSIYKELKNLELIDRAVCKAEWYLKIEETKKAYYLFRLAWFTVIEICERNNVKTIDEYDKRYSGYDCLLNWIQYYDEILEFTDEKKKMYERLRLCDNIEKVFDLNQESELYWKEKFIRAKANTEFKLGNEKVATEIIEKYLTQKPDWAWGYIEMADWYSDQNDKENYDIERAKQILLKAEQIKDMEDIDVVYERLWDIYNKLGDKAMAKIYDEKMNT